MLLNADQDSGGAMLYRTFENRDLICTVEEAYLVVHHITFLLYSMQFDQSEHFVMHDVKSASTIE